MKIYIMGLFNLFDSNASKRKEICNIVLKLSTGLAQIDEDRRKNGNEITPFAKGILYLLSEESRTLYNILSPNGRTNWDLANTMVKEYDGREIRVSEFCQKLYREGINLYKVTGINIAFSL